MKSVETLAPGIYLDYNKVIDYINKISLFPGSLNSIEQLLNKNTETIKCKDKTFITKKELARWVSAKFLKEIQCNVTSIMILDSDSSDLNQVNPIVNNVKFIENK